MHFICIFNTRNQSQVDRKLLLSYSKFMRHLVRKCFRVCSINLIKRVQEERYGYFHLMYVSDFSKFTKESCIYVLPGPTQLKFTIM